MEGHRLSVSFIVGLVGVILSSAPIAWASDKKDPNLNSVNTGTQEFLDYVNNWQSFPEHQTWAIFLGTGWTKEKLQEIQDQIQKRELINPFTGKPFDPSNTKVFAFGQKNPLAEAARVVTDHFEIHILSSLEELKGHHFDFGICHSNGCPNAIDAHRMGIMRVDTFLALGTGWTSKDFHPGDLKGAKLIFFATTGDPIWKFPAPNWARITEDTPGLKFSIRFESLKEIPKGLWNFFMKGRADLDTFPVIRLDTPSGQEGTFFKPFRSHAIFASYFQALDRWMKSEGNLQKALAEKIRRLEASAYREHQKEHTPFPPGCPWCDGGGGAAEEVERAASLPGQGVGWYRAPLAPVGAGSLPRFRLPPVISARSEGRRTGWS